MATFGYHVERCEPNREFSHITDYAWNLAEAQAAQGSFLQSGSGVDA